MTTSEKIIEVIANQLGVDKEMVLPSANIVDDLGADSLDVTELAMALEETFDIEISDDDAGNIRTVQDIFDYLKERRIFPETEAA